MNELQLLLQKSKIYYLDFETTGLDPHVDKPLILALKSELGAKAFLLDETNNETIMKYYNEDTPVVAHNAKFDLKFLKKHYGKTPKKVFCTQVMAQVAYNGIRDTNSLESLLKDFLGIKLNKTYQKSFINAKLENLSEQQINYALEDVMHLEALAKFLKKRLTQEKLMATFLFEMDFLPYLVEVELYGVLLDSTKWMELLRVKEIELKNNLVELDTLVVSLIGKHKKTKYHNTKFYKIRTENSKKEELLSYTGDELYEILRATETLKGFKENADIKDRLDKKVSKKIIKNEKKYEGLSQLFDVPIDYEKLHQIKLKDSERYSTGKDNILDARTSFAEDSLERAFLDKLLENRELNKYISTYGETFLKNINPVTGKIHTDYTQTYTDTGRLSSSNPNLQNIPRKKEMRACFVAEEGTVLYTIDMDQQELRVAADMSKDELLIASSSGSIDLHSELAKVTYGTIYKKPMEISKKVNGNLRDQHKPVIFGFIYGAEAFRIHQLLDIALPLAEEVYANLSKVLSGLVAFQKTIKKKAVTTLKVVANEMGRKRYFDKTKKAHKIEKEACNFPIQSTCADQIKRAWINVMDYLKTTYDDPRYRVLLQVHDELVIQGPPGIGPQLAQIMSDTANQFIKHKDLVKMTCEASEAIYWKK